MTLTTRDRPNVLWLTIEDTSPQFIGAYGARTANTPTIDALADEGIRFERAYSVGTVCAPSRSALITGCPPWQLGTGHHRSAYPIPQRVIGFPAYLREAGYYASNNVKTDYNTSAHDRLVAQSWDESSADAGWWGRTDPSQPFFSVFNVMTSHQMWTMSLPYEEYRSHILGQLPEDAVVSDADVEMPPFLRDSPQMRRQFARIHNSIALTDRQLREILDRLEGDGLRENTVICFFADHGEGMPRGKTNGIALGYRVPMAIWLPERWQHLSPWPRGSVVTDELVSFEDLAPTMLSICGLPVPEQMSGRVLLGPGRSPAPDFGFGASDRADEGTDLERAVMSGDHLYARHFMPFQPQMRWIEYQEISEIKTLMRQDQAGGLLTDEQDALFRPRPYESLYNVREDPWEMSNLIDDPALAGRADACRAALREHLIADRDVMLLPEYELSRISDDTTPYEHRLTSAYPIEDVVDAALLSGRRDPSALSAQRRLLGSDTAVLRYWGVVGLHSHDASSLEPLRAQILGLVADDYPPVSLWAAGLAYRLWADAAAYETLCEAALAEDAQVALLALHQIALLDEVAEFADVAASVAARPGIDITLRAATRVLLHRTGRAPLAQRRFADTAAGRR